MNRNNLTVLFCIGTAEIGGTELQLVRLSQELARRGVEVHLAFLNAGGPLLHRIDTKLVTPHVFSIRRHRQGPKEMIRFLSLLKKTDFNLIHAFLPHAIVIARWATFVSRTRVPFIAGIRNQLQKYEREARLLLANALRSADQITVNAPSLASETAGFAGIDPNRIATITNGVDIPPFRNDVAIQPPRAVMLANFHAYKGHELLIQALAHTSSSLTVDLIGSGPEKTRIQELVSKFALNHRVHFLEAPTGADLSPYQFGIHPSLTEGLPNAILEQMASGLPIVASKVGGIPLLLDENGGILCNPRDSAELAEAIDTLALDPILRQRLGNRNRREALNYGWDSICNQYMNLYQDLTS